MKKKKKEEQTDGKKKKRRVIFTDLAAPASSPAAHCLPIPPSFSRLFPRLQSGGPGPQHLPRWHEPTLPAASRGSAAPPTSKKEKRFHLKPASFSGPANRPRAIWFGVFFGFFFVLLLFLPPCAASVFGIACLYMHMSSLSPLQSVF